MFNHEFISKCVENYNKNPVNYTISPKETMWNEWYRDVGYSAVQVIIAALSASFLSRVERVLDVPCGHGRVLRHLSSLFPDAEFTACDLDREGVAFCSETFGALPLVSCPELSEVDFGKKFDLIWVGSLFTHTPEAQTKRWLAHLAKFLTPTGVMVSTFHGRRAIQVYEMGPFIAASSWKSIVEQYQRTGYGYASYSTEETHEYMDNDYGVSLSSPDKIMAIAKEIPGIRIFQYAERAWADNQDVLVIGRPAVNEQL